MAHARGWPRMLALFCGVVLLVALPTALPEAHERLVHVTLLQLNDVYQLSPVDRGMRGGLAAMGLSAPHTDGRIQRLDATAAEP